MQSEKYSKEESQNLLSRSTSMRFQPNSRASTDHAPGPSSANAAPMVAMKMQAEGSPGRVMMFHSASAATSEPASGVHNPASRSIPIMIATTGSVMNWMDGPPNSLAKPWITSEAPATRRMSRRPAPGQPGAKVEYRRRNYAPDNQSGYRIEESAESLERGAGKLFRVSWLDDSALYANHGGVGSVICAQF